MIRSLQSFSNLERQELIDQFIEEHSRVTVMELCDRFQISSATARRDLQSLEKQRRIKRVHGGAISGHLAPPEAPIIQRSRIMSEQKHRIGTIAAGLVKDGETIFLGSGTSVLEVAKELTSRKNLTIITNSIPVINLLSQTPGMTMIVVGGLLRTSEMSLIGHLSEVAINELHADKVFMGIHAIDLEHGLTNDYLPETMTDRAILGIGRQVIVVADHTKCGRVSTVLVAPLESVHYLITDDQTSLEFINNLRTLGIIVLIA